MSKPYPNDNWVCRCPDSRINHHAPGVRLCFVCGDVNPTPRVSRPVAQDARQTTSKPLSGVVGDLGRAPGCPAPKTPKQARETRQPTLTEQRYHDLYLRQPIADGECRAVFEGLTLRLANGHRYTPDWAVFWYADKGVKKVHVELVEVKGAYKLGSYQRARLAFDQASIEFPEFEFVWYEETKGEQG